MLDYDTVVKIKEYLQRQGRNEVEVRDIMVHTLKHKFGWVPRSNISWYVTKYDKGIDLHEINNGA